MVFLAFPTEITKALEKKWSQCDACRRAATALKQAVDIKEIKKWSIEEGMESKFEVFMNTYKTKLAKKE